MKLTLRRYPTPWTWPLEVYRNHRRFRYLSMNHAHLRLLDGRGISNFDLPTPPAADPASIGPRSTFTECVDDLMGQDGFEP